MVRAPVQFNRVTLYEEVWERPMLHVAAAYGLSDVALRKICLKLKIPVPDRDHWAKAATGKVPKSKPLPKTEGPSTYAHVPRNQYVDEKILARLPAVLAQFPDSISRIPTATIRSSIQDCDPLIQLMVSRIKKAPRGQRGWPSISGGDVLGISVSPNMQTHALLVLDALVRCARGTGFKLVSTSDNEKNAHFLLDNQGLGVRLTERARRIKRDLTPDELRRKKAGTLYWIKDEFDFHSTGELKLEVFDADNHYKAISTSSKQVSPLADRIEETVQRMIIFAAELVAAEQVAAERKERAEAQAIIKAKVREKGRLCLDRLEICEQAAQQLNRAQVLRSLAQACRTKVTSNGDQIALASWIEQAADWLDPLLLQSWPEVDEAIAAGLLSYDSKWHRVSIGEGDEDDRS